ncbi:MAG TPA: glycosyltransferase family 2 protein, partial [Chthoniobacteraceae bacterium]
MSPLVSIVVPTLNQGRYIEQTLASLAGQNWPNLELIVIDGGSTDETASVVESYRHVVTHFVSEKDRGQADAINKGFRLAKGEILGWLNSDDYLLPCALARTVRALGGPSTEPRLAYGGCLAVWEGTRKAEAWPAFPFDREALKTMSLVSQPGSLWTRALWEKTGELDPDYHFVLDWDWYLRASGHGAFTALPDLLAVYRFHPAHKSSRGERRRTEEILALVEQHAGPEWGAAFR